MTVLATIHPHGRWTSRKLTQFSLFISDILDEDEEVIRGVYVGDTSRVVSVDVVDGFNVNEHFGCFGMFHLLTRTNHKLTFYPIDMSDPYNLKFHEGVDAVDQPKLFALMNEHFEASIIKECDKTSISTKELELELSRYKSIIGKM